MVAVPVLFVMKTDVVKSLSSCFLFSFYINNHLDNHRNDKHQKLVNVLLWYFPQSFFSQLFLINFLDLFLLGLLVGESVGF